ncbi:MAG: two-component sensor histidine kinase [Caulobacteraceae bacterium]|nr:two-component sensor histidine kinase [Caulobacteraceae bacterium]
MAALPDHFSSLKAWLGRRFSRRWIWPGGLSARLLFLTAVFVLLVGAAAIPPSLAQFEQQWLEYKLATADALASANEQGLEGGDTRQLTEGSDLLMIRSKGNDEVDRFILLPPKPTPFDYIADLRRAPMQQGPSPCSGRAENTGLWLAAPFQTLARRGSGLVCLIGDQTGGGRLTVVLRDRSLHRDLVNYLKRLIGLTALAALAIGVVVFISLNLFLVRPMQRITRSMERFRANPDDASAAIPPSGRRDEIGRAEAELDRMQADLRAALASRARLADLGEAMAKINHDLRNLLTSAQMASDRLAALEDPKVAEALPRLERALDRAITLTSSVLSYGRNEPAPPPQPQAVPMLEALQGAAEDAGLANSGIDLRLGFGPEGSVLADPEQLHRILVNLLRNSREAIEEAAPKAGGRIEASFGVEGEVRRLTLTDNGPGIPKKALDKLFQPFLGSSRRGGTGLGLAISRELAKANGGDLVLAKTGAGGSVFVLTLPGA